VFRYLVLALWISVALPSFGEPVPAPKSILLVARKDLPDPFFRDSVVLITQSTGGTPIGIIVNRPTQVPLSRVFPKVEKLGSRNDKLFFGGPVVPEQLVVLFRAQQAPAGALEVLDGVYMTSDRERFADLLGRENPLDGARVFAGYAGWAPGQLEAEVARGDWHLARADARTLFETRPERLWQELERRAAATRTPVRGSMQKKGPRRALEQEE
jgi:putative transcriptional regulator